MKNPYRKISRKRSASRPAQAPSKAPVRMKARPRRVSSKREENLYDRSGEFNPQAFDRPASRGITASNKQRRMFNKKGEVNAYDKQDALTQIAHLLGNVTKKNADALSIVPDSQARMSNDDRRKVLAAALNDPSGQGFHMVGQELALPIKAILDYEGFGRKMYRVRKLGQA